VKAFKVLRLHPPEIVDAAGYVDETLLPWTERMAALAAVKSLCRGFHGTPGIGLRRCIDVVHHVISG
jgi:hypothetical protein